MGYYNTINLINYAPYPSAATTGNYAIFYIGYTGSYSGKVDACDKSLTVSNIQSMLNERIDTAATTVGDYAVFAGGSANGSTYFSLAGVYNSSLVYQEISNVLTYKTIDVGTTTIGDYALFVGGQGSSKYAQVNTLSSSLTKSGLTSLNDRGYSIAGATIGNYAIFAGGYREVNGNNSYSVSTIVDAFDSSLTHSLASSLGTARGRLKGTVAGKYAVFTGGNSALVDAYNESLTRISATNINVARTYLAATSIEDYALFGGGQSGSGYSYSYHNTVDAYDSSLTHTTQENLSVGRANLAAATVGDYALFGGGTTKASDTYKTIDVYTVS